MGRRGRTLRSLVAVPALALAALAPAGGGTSTPVAPASGASAPAARPAASFRGAEWERLPTSRRLVALTFDACGGDEGAAAILKTLAAERIRATFFLCGSWADAHAATARRIAARYAVGNHTQTHPYLTALSDSGVDEEILAGARTIVRVTGADPRPLFRFPFGDRDVRTLARVGRLGYGSVRWTVDTLGWKGAAGGQSVASVRARVLAGLRPGEIVLMHVGAAPDRTTLDAAALPSVITELRRRGYAFADVFAYAASYRQTVDDSAAGRFRASSSWRRGTSAPRHHGEGYRLAQPRAVSDPALFRVRVPQTARYAVAAWWPVGAAFSRDAPIGIDTTTGRRWVHVDQRYRGGRWVPLGTHLLRAGDEWSVRVSRWTGARGGVVADAIRVGGT